MDSTELYTAFREDVVDTARPYLWSDNEVFRYMNEAYRMFVRLTGGVADFTSDATLVDVVTGEGTVTLHPSLLRVRSPATLRSNGREIKVLNPEDSHNLNADDYGRIRPLLSLKKPGDVRYMIIGGERNKAQLVNIPTVDDVIEMYIYRLPLVTIDGRGQEFDDVADDHHNSFLFWMKHLAYKKQDAETFDRGRSKENEDSFRAYCKWAKAEWERYKHKTRVVEYGGIG